MTTIATSASHAVTAQHAALDRLHQHTGQQVRAAFHIARANAAQSLATFTRAYGDELKRAREANDASEDVSQPQAAQAARVSLIWLHTSGHLDSLRGPVLRSMQQATHASLEATLAGQRDAFHRAQTLGAQQVQASKDDDDETLVILPPVPTDRYGLSSYDSRPLANYFDQLPPAAWQRVQKAVNAAAATAESERDLLNALVDILAGIAAWALLIALQELTGAFRAMFSWLFGANDLNWRWHAQPDACPFCLSMDGTVHDGSEELDSHPRCRCVQEPTHDPVTTT